MIAAAALARQLGPVLTHSADNGNGDPLFYFGLNWEVWLIVIIKCLVAFVALLVATALMIWFERKVISDMQSRVGPNRAGPWGLLQTLADGTKLVFKEDLLPDRADAFVFKLAPYLSVIPAVLVFTVVPVGGVITIGEPHLRAAGGRPAHGDPARAGHVGHRRLRRHAGRLVVGLEVPAARLGAGLGPGDLLRGRARHDHGHGGAGDRLALAPGPSWPPSPTASGTGTSSGSASCPSSSS